MIYGVDQFSEMRAASMTESGPPSKSQQLPQKVPCIQGETEGGQGQAHEERGDEKAHEVRGNEGEREVEDAGIRVHVTQ